MQRIDEALGDVVTRDPAIVAKTMPRKRPV